MNNDTRLLIEDAEIFYLNFSGLERKPYNPAGKRVFCVRVAEDVAPVLKKDGWNVKIRASREDDDEGATGGYPYIQVQVAYNKKPPKVVMIAGEGGPRTILGEDMIDILDTMDIQKVDLIVNGFHYPDLGSGPGISGYLKTMYVTIEMDYLEQKYEDNLFQKPNADLGPEVISDEFEYADAE